jgi:PKHD-type hydroxylase
MIHLSNPELPLQFVFEVENIFDNQELEFLSSYFSNKNLFEANLTSKKVDKEIRKTDIAWLDPEDATEHIYHKLFSLVKHVNDQHYHWNLTWIETIQYGEYGEGGHYKLHTDAGLHGEEGDNRKLSFSLLLNDDYEGGELEIPGSPGQPDVFKPKANSAIFFPSFIPHCVQPVTKGIRKSLVGWVHGPNFV